MHKHGANVPGHVHFVPGAVEADGFISPVISDIFRGLAKKRADRDNADDSAMGSWYNFFMEAFAITAARNFARVLLIRAENTMTHLGMLGARRPVSLVDAESLRMWVVPDSPDTPPLAGARKRPRPRNGALQPIQRKPRTA